MYVCIYIYIYIYIYTYIYTYTHTNTHTRTHYTHTRNHAPGTESELERSSRILPENTEGGTHDDIEYEAKRAKVRFLE